MPASRTRLLLGCLILAILAAAAWWALNLSGQGSPIPDSSGAGADAPEDGTPAEGMLSDTPAAGQDLERIEAAAAQEAPAADGLSLTIRTLDAVTRAPIAGAEIHFLWQEDPNYMPTLNRSRTTDREQEYRQFGQSLRSNERGEASIPITGASVSLIARSGTRFGIGTWRAAAAGPPGCEILLGEDRKFSVRVIDAAGAPVAQVPLSLFTPTDWVPRDLRLTDADGYAHFLHLQTRFQREGEVPDLTLGFAFPLADPPHVVIRWQEPPPEPITLVMPPTGVLAVEVFDSNGSAWQKRASIDLQRHVDPPPGREPAQSFQPRLALGHCTAMLDEHGVARFAFVGLGLQLDAGSRFTPGLNTWTVTTGAGPLSEGGGALLTLRTGPQPAVVLFRLMQPDGQPTPDVPYQGMLLWYDGAGGLLERDNGGSSAMDGLRRVAIPLEEPAGWVRRECRMYQQEPTLGELPLTAVLDLSAPLQPGENDLGEVMTQVAPLIAGGRVVDENGNSVFGAQIEAQYQGEESQDPLWFLNVRFPSMTDAAGRFSIGGTLRTGEHLLVAKHHSFLDARAPLVLGADSHHLVMPAGCSVSGAVLLDEGNPPREINVLIVRDGKEVRFIDRPVSYTLRPDGSFEQGGLTSGLVGVRFRVGLAGQILAEVPDVMLAPTAPPDPRLNPLDLRGKFRRVRLLVQDQDGVQLQQVSAGLLDGSAGLSRWPSSWNGQAIFYLTAPSVRVGVLAPGYMGQIIENLSADAEVRLQRAPEVEFVLQDPEILGKHPSVYLQSIWLSALSRPVSTPIALDEAGHGRMTLPGWGDYRISLWMPVNDGSEAMPVSGQSMRDWPAFTFAPGAPITPVVVPCSLAEVDRAISEFEEHEDE
jgi:hypothetical protein